MGILWLLHARLAQKGNPCRCMNCFQTDGTRGGWWGGWGGGDLARSGTASVPRCQNCRSGRRTPLMGPGGRTLGGWGGGWGWWGGGGGEGQPCTLWDLLSAMASKLSERLAYPTSEASRSLGRASRTRANTSSASLLGECDRFREFCRIIHQLISQFCSLVQVLCERFITSGIRDPGIAVALAKVGSRQVWDFC